MSEESGHGWNQKATSARSPRAVADEMMCCCEEVFEQLLGAEGKLYDLRKSVLKSSIGMRH